MQSLVRFSLMILALATAGMAQSISWQPAAKPWDRSLGTHRIIVVIEAAAPAVRAHLEWRRRDTAPEKKAVWVFDLKSGSRIENAVVENVGNDTGDLVFQPVGGVGEYAVYFLPVKISGGAFPKSDYFAQDDKSDAKWKETWKGAAGQALPNNLPQAKPVRWECLTAHDGWNEMEVIATAAEIEAWLKAHPGQDTFTFIEDAAHSVRMFDHVPERWLKRGKEPVITGRQGGTLTFQIAVWAAARDAKLMSGGLLKFHDASGGMVNWPSRPLNLNTDPQHGSALAATVRKGTVFPVWWQVEVPADAKPGRYRAVASDHAGREVEIEISPAAPPDPMGRLAWLDLEKSNPDVPVPPYVATRFQGHRAEILGRTIEFNCGLPAAAVSHFNKAVTKISPESRFPILAGPVRWIFGDAESGSLTEFDDGCAARGKVKGTGGEFSVEGRAQLEYDGLIHGRWTITAPLASNEAPQLTDLRLEIPLNPAAAQYWIGLGQAGGLSPEEFEWKWDVANRNQDSVWIGAVNGGLRLQLKDEKYVRPAVNIHYKRRPLVEPSWANGGKGGIRFSRKGGRAMLTAFTGPIAFKPGQAMHFDFELMITPFHTLRTAEQWTERYYQGPVPSLLDAPKWLDNLRSQGANIVNVHQGNHLNPYINYPFVTADRLKQFTELAHQRDIRVKYYYTIRELSNWAPEIFALRAMGDDVLLHGNGGGHPWGEEHLGGDYYGAWFEPGVQDVSYLTQTMGRWNNYYIEGLRWLCDHCGCDGLYLDDISFDRTVMRRAQEVLQKHAPRGGRIDLHSWNELHGGGAWANCANLFMDSFPFVDRLWFGEGHHYSGPPPEHFLVEISGVPYGLMGEMLEHGGNPWLGLVHGCTGRLGWGGNPRPVWKLWDDFGVKDSEFIGWWAEEECPVRCEDPLVRATVWAHPGKRALVAVGNFAGQPRKVKLQIDWKKLGLDPAKAKLYAPPVPDYGQREGLYAAADELFLRPVAGAVFYLDETARTVAPPPPTGSASLGKQTFEEIFRAGSPPADATANAAGWKWTGSAKASGAAKFDEGFVLTAPANVHAWLERDLPASTGAVQTRIWQDPKDGGQQWGPGLAVVWENGRTLKVNRRQDGRIGIGANGRESMPASVSAKGEIEFLIAWDKETIRIHAGGPAMGGQEEEIASFPRKEFTGAPKSVRLGKMPDSGQAKDFGEAGAAGFCRWQWLRIFEARPGGK